MEYLSEIKKNSYLKRLARRFERSPAETNGRKSRVQEGLNEEERRGRSLTWLLFQHFSSASFVKIFEKSLKRKKSHF